jgi:hypothetical protein
MTKALDGGAVAREAAMPKEAGPFNPHESLGYLPIGGHVSYALDPEWITLGPSAVATPKTYVEFEGRTAYGDRSRIPFHVTSLDWLESDRVLAGIMTAFGSPTGAVPLGGAGQFDGVMLLAFTKPRVEGTFTGEHMRAWDTEWGRQRQGRDREQLRDHQRVSSPTARRRSGLTAFPRLSRKDNGDEINARIFITRRRLADLLGMHRARRLSGRGPRVRRYPPVRELRDAVRLRPPRDRSRHCLRRNL